MTRENPFKPIYDICNGSDPEVKLQNLADFPIYMDIELTNHCNFNCLMCPTGTGIMKRQRGFMSDEIYDKILDEIKGKKVALRFIRWGEPMLHESFLEYMQKAKDQGIVVHFNTNGSLLTREKAQKLIDIKIDSVKFSFQGVDVASYNEMRCNGSFDDLIGNIKMLYDLRGDKPVPYIHIATTTTYETEEQTEAFKQRVLPFCDLVSVGKTRLEHIETGETKLSAQNKEKLNELKKKEIPVTKRLACCPEVYDKLSIDWNGDVTACCGDYNGEMIVGNILESTLEEIWNCVHLNRYRRVLSRRQYDCIKLCSQCFDYMGT